MDDLMAATQGDRAQQRRVTELTLRALKEIFPSLPAKLKDSISLKKAMQGDGDWATWWTQKRHPQPLPQALV